MHPLNCLFHFVHCNLRSLSTTVMRAGATVITVVTLSLLSLQSCSTADDFTPRAIPVVLPQTHLFSPGDVRLLDGPFKISQDAEAQYLLGLDLDRLLAPFLIESGLPIEAKPYPGWETETLPGVALSFYLSGASRLYALTGNAEFRRRMDYILNELEQCQVQHNGYVLGSRGGFHILTLLETEGFFPEFHGWIKGHGTPYYALDKLFSGLMDAYCIGKSKKALKIAVHLADWLERHMSKISDEDLQQIMRIEYGGMSWVLSDMYKITGNSKFLDMSGRWQDNTVVIPTVEGTDVLTRIHANTQFPKMSGLAARYPYTGDVAELKGARFFWDNVVNHRSYVTGGNSESERFSARDSLSNTLTLFNAENCNEYNMLKLTALLFRSEPRVEYADYMERTLFNHILVAQNPEDLKICYFLPLMPGAQRLYENHYERFSCCECSALDSYTRHAEYIYAHTESELFVNLFIASEVQWHSKNIRVIQETRFPEQDGTTLRFQCEDDVSMTLKIRYPAWVSGPMTISVNGTALDATMPPDRYVSVNRTWSNGDVVEIGLPMGLRTECMPDDADIIAFFHGPILLAGVLDQEMAVSLLEADAAPALVAGDMPADQWVIPAGGSLRYVTTVCKPAEIPLKPFYTVKTGPYTVYWQKTSENEWKDRLARADKKLQDEKKLERITLDRLVVGDSLSEAEHHLSGSSRIGFGNAAIFTEEAWRIGTDPEGFGYEMQVSGSEPVAILCKYIGRTHNGDWAYRIQVDSVTITEFTRDWSKRTLPMTPFHVIYPIPPQLTKGKKKVTIVIESNDVNMAIPRLMEMRIIRQ